MNTQKQFALDKRGKFVQEADYVIFLHTNPETKESDMFCAMVLGLRVVDGNYEVNAAGPYGGWKRTFYKAANK